ncbi:MAG: hypothetical protein LBK18_08855 [Prevotellaceae bacterium]|jgi:multidrug resistance efflux pump|nr:hypothetical protein [Prevotellaceae bacterium]
MSKVDMFTAIESIKQALSSTKEQLKAQQAKVEKLERMLQQIKSTAEQKPPLRHKSL